MRVGTGMGKALGAQTTVGEQPRTDGSRIMAAAHLVAEPPWVSGVGEHRRPWRALPQVKELLWMSKMLCPPQ
jgi:hypothetical protein